MDGDLARVVRTSFENGTWSGDTPLTELRGIGAYLEARLRVAVNEGGGPLTMREFVHGFRRLSAPRVMEILLRALQNARANQCVPPKVRAATAPPSSRTRAQQRSPRRLYHAGDVNERGLDAAITLLEYARRSRLFGVPLTFATPLPRWRRGRAAKDCGCLPQSMCSGSCAYVSGVCVPRDNRVRGFQGVPYHPSQSASAHTDAERRRVRRSARTNVTQQVRNDGDSMADVRAGHDPQMHYVVRGNRMWRRPGSKVRLPVMKR